MDLPTMDEIRNWLYASSPPTETLYAAFENIRERLIAAEARKVELLPNDDEEKKNWHCPMCASENLTAKFEREDLPYGNPPIMLEARAIVMRCVSCDITFTDWRSAEIRDCVGNAYRNGMNFVSDEVRKLLRLDGPERAIKDIHEHVTSLTIEVGRLAGLVDKDEEDD